MGDNETRTKIIKAAEELFKQKDYEDISIREICQLADISIGAFYRHIGSKEQLFKIFHIQLGTEALKILFERIDNKTPMEKIFVVIDIYLDLITYFGYKFVKYFLTLSLNNEIFANPPGALHTFLKEYITEGLNRRYGCDIPEQINSRLTLERKKLEQNSQNIDIFLAAK